MFSLDCFTQSKVFRYSLWYIVAPILKLQLCNRKCISLIKVARMNSGGGGLEGALTHLKTLCSFCSCWPKGQQNMKKVQQACKVGVRFSIWQYTSVSVEGVSYIASYTVIDPSIITWHNWSGLRVCSTLREKQLWRSFQLDKLRGDKLHNQTGNWSFL